MGNNCRGTNLQYSADISHSRSIHSHADDTVMSSRQVAITPILKLEALVAVSAEVSLISSTSLSIFHNIICFSTPDAHNLNYSHLILKQKFRNISDQQLWFMTYSALYFSWRNASNTSYSLRKNSQCRPNSSEGNIIWVKLCKNAQTLVWQLSSSMA